MLTFDLFLIRVYCLFDEHLRSLPPLRSRGFSPAFSDAECLTCEAIGEFLGLDCDEHIWAFFKMHYSEWFPTLPSRSQFARQSANLWWVKQELQLRLARSLGAFSDPIHIIDGVPIPVCHLARKGQSRSFKGEATVGYCATKKEYYYGFKGHLLVSFDGLITGFTLTPSTTDERVASWDILSGIKGKLLADKGYLSAAYQEALRKEVRLKLLTLKRANMKQVWEGESPSLIVRVRRLVETVISQLTERFNLNRVWARDLWHLTSRIGRKLLSHTVAAFFNKQEGIPLLQFEHLIAA